jgi:transcriptional regulator with XRE-family HTH domain
MTTMNTDRAWLTRMAEREAEHTVSVGGWITDLEQAGFGAQPVPPTRSAFVRLLQLARRERRLSMEAFARDAGIDLTELISLEHAESYTPSRDTVLRIAQFLQLPEEKLLSLAGLAAPADAPLCDAAARFTARSEPTPSLTREEREALTEFVGFLCNR